MEADKEDVRHCRGGYAPGYPLARAVRVAFPYVIGFGVALGGVTGVFASVWTDIGVFVLGLAIFSVGLYAEEKSLR